MTPRLHIPLIHDGGRGGDVLLARLKDLRHRSRHDHSHAPQVHDDRPEGDADTDHDEGHASEPQVRDEDGQEVPEEDQGMETCSTLLGLQGHHLPANPDVVAGQDEEHEEREDSTPGEVSSHPFGPHRLLQGHRLRTRQVGPHAQDDVSLIAQTLNDEEKPVDNTGEHGHEARHGDDREEGLRQGESLRDDRIGGSAHDVSSSQGRDEPGGIASEKGDNEAPHEESERELRKLGHQGCLDFRGLPVPQGPNHPRQDPCLRPQVVHNRGQAQPDTQDDERQGPGPLRRPQDLGEGSPGLGRKPEVAEIEETRGDDASKQGEQEVERHQDQAQRHQFREGLGVAGLRRHWHLASREALHVGGHGVPPRSRQIEDDDDNRHADAKGQECQADESPRRRDDPEYVLDLPCLNVLRCIRRTSHFEIVDILESLSLPESEAQRGDNDDHPEDEVEVEATRPPQQLRRNEPFLHANHDL